MREKVRVLVFGLTALLEGIAICLEHDPNILLQQVQAEYDDALNLTTQFKPDVVIYQCGCPESEQILLHLPALGGMCLVGLDVEKNQAVVFESETVVLCSISGVRRLILTLRRNRQGSDFPDYPAEEIMGLESDELIA